MSPFRIFRAVWENRFRRWFTVTWWKDWDVQQRIMMWTKETGEKEKGEFCVVDEMQVIYEKGWRHV